jgi:hypothetical protein
LKIKYNLKNVELGGEKLLCVHKKVLKIFDHSSNENLSI